MSSVVISGDTSGAITLTAPAVAGTNTLTLPAETGTLLTSGSGGQGIGAGNASIMKNRIINGAMVIDQRNAGASVTVNGAGGFTYYLDRWNMYVSQNGKGTIQQNQGSVTPPVGFTNYLGFTSSSAYTVGSSELFDINQFIEGYNVSDLGWGTANAKTVTLSFWVRSSLTGTFGGAITNNDQNRSYPFTYTISAANTWTQASITILGDQTGTWLTTNGKGLFLSFGIGVGSTLSGTAGSWSGNSYFSATGATSVVGTSGATFYITGVQLEVGSSATGFEYDNYGVSLYKCQRYYQLVADSAGATSAALGAGMCLGGTDFYYPLRLPQNMRANPTFALIGTVRYYKQPTPASGTTTSITFENTNTNSTRMFVVGSGGTSGNGSWLQLEGGSATDKLTASAEL